MSEENKEPFDEEKELAEDEALEPEVPGLGIDVEKLWAEEPDSVQLLQQVYQLWWRWADFHLYITTPNIEKINPPILIHPEIIPHTQEKEFVYVIHDSGYKLSTSKGEDMMSAGMSMCKLFFTIEKMISILIERLKSGGIDKETEVQIAFSGHELAQRKAFESVINLEYNVIVTNFEPGKWGESYLANIKRMAERFGYPKEAPRETYKHSYKSLGMK